MLVNNILTDEEKESIHQEIIRIFGEEGSKAISFDLLAFKSAIDNVVKEMDLQEYSYIDYWSGDQPITVVRKKMSQTVLRKNYLAMRGFMLIFKFREYLFNTAIDYRYYYSDQDGVHQKTFNEMDLLDFSIFTDGKIKLNIDMIKKKAQDGASFFIGKMNQYINIYTNPEKNQYMQKRDPARYNLRIVRKYIMDTYFSQNPGLKTKDGRYYQTFNMGHIYESLDLAITHTFMDFGEEKMDYYIDNYMFGKYLKRDNVVASKGGDNFLTNTSIKSNQANLYNFKTIANQLYLIQQMLLLTNEQQLKNEIINLFIDISDKSQDIKNDLERSAQKAVDKLLNEIQNSLSIT